MSHLPQASRLHGARCALVRGMPRRQTNAPRVPGDGRADAPRSVHELSYTSCARRRCRVVPIMPFASARGSSGQRSVHRVPRPPRRRHDRQSQCLHDLPREGRSVGHGHAWQGTSLHQLPPSSRLSPSCLEPFAMHRLSCWRDLAREPQSRPRRLQLMPRKVGAPALAGTGMRDLPHQGGSHRTRGTPEMRVVPRAARRRATAPSRHLHGLPPEQEPGLACRSQDRLRDLPSRPRSGGNRPSTNVRQLSRGQVAPCPARRAFAREMQPVPHVAPSAELRSRHVYGRMSPRSPKPPAQGGGLHRLPRFSTVAC
jgi:hypothetical protein